MDYLQLAQTIDKHTVSLASETFWGAIAALTTIIGLLATIAFQAGKMRSRLDIMVPKVDAIHHEMTEHAKVCDTERALTDQRVASHEARIAGLESS